MAQDREQQFWNQQARGLALAQVRRECHFVEREALWGWARDRVRQRAPTRVLDMGCGRGATTSLLAREWPRVVGCDVALEALKVGRRLAATERNRPEFVAGALESLPFRDRSFDVVAGRFVLHHAADLGRAAGEIARVLEPGGVGVFIETWGANPLLRAGREFASWLGAGIGTDDERPLVWDDVERLGQHFQVELCWPSFMALGLSDRVWRRTRPVLSRSGRARRWIGQLWQGAMDGDQWLDRRVPALRPYGWFAGLVLTRR